MVKFRRNSGYAGMHFQKKIAYLILGNFNHHLLIIETGADHDREVTGISQFTQSHTKNQQ
jgi:hypothetical protein